MPATQQPHFRAPPICTVPHAEQVPTKPEELPTWNYDGSSTGQVMPPLAGQRPT